jgi:hypothetical protein
MGKARQLADLLDSTGDVFADFLDNTDANITTKGLYEHAHTISTNYTIATNKNALTAGPVTIATNAAVTIPTGSTWVIA